MTKPKTRQLAIDGSPLPYGNRVCPSTTPGRCPLIGCPDHDPENVPAWLKALEWKDK